MTDVVFSGESIALEEEDEVAGLVADLIRIPSVNTGNPETIGDGEARAARYVCDRLAEVGIEAVYLESAPGRANVVCRLKGSDPALEALLLHAHLDVVPANEEEWSVPPFSGEIRDGMLYGRGAVDMKNMAGMMLAIARGMARDQFRPKRDIVFMWFADEENGSVYGSEWMTKNHRDLFAGVTNALSEVGGFSITLPNGKRAYLLATAEKGGVRAKLTARGTGGHGALINDDNPVTRLAGAVYRLGQHRFALQKTPHLQALLDGLSELLGVTFHDDTLDAQLDELGFISRTIRASLRNTANPTMLTAGVKRNVIPSTAEAQVDCRILPGTQDAFVEEVLAILGPGIDVEWTFGWTIESPVKSKLVDEMTAAIQAEDPEARILPYLLPGGTDNKLLAKIGINGYGFVPLKVPDGFDVWGLFHAPDERIPVDALKFGVRVFHRMLRRL